MQRQSLGSPGSSSSSSSSPSSGRPPHDDAGSKARKKAAGQRAPAAASTIHFIPALTLFCFLVLYLVSHDPSPADMAAAFGRPGAAGTGAGGGAASADLSGHRGLKQAERLLPHRAAAGGRPSRKLRGGVRHQTAGSRRA